MFNLTFETMEKLSVSGESWRKTRIVGMFVLAWLHCDKIPKITNLQREKALGVHNAGGFNPAGLIAMAVYHGSGMQWRS